MLIIGMILVWVCFWIIDMFAPTPNINKALKLLTVLIVLLILLGGGSHYNYIRW